MKHCRVTWELRSGIIGLPDWGGLTAGIPDWGGLTAGIPDWGVLTTGCVGELLGEPSLGRGHQTQTLHQPINQLNILLS